MTTKLAATMFGDIDRASAALAIQLQLEDLQELSTFADNSGGGATDSGAINVLRTMLEEEASLLEDRRLALSIDPEGRQSLAGHVLAATRRNGRSTTRLPAPRFRVQWPTTQVESRNITVNTFQVEVSPSSVLPETASVANSDESPSSVEAPIANIQGINIAPSTTSLEVASNSNEIVRYVSLYTSGSDIFANEQRTAVISSREENGVLPTSKTQDDEDALTQSGGDISEYPVHAFTLSLSGRNTELAILASEQQEHDETFTEPSGKSGEESELTQISSVGDLNAAVMTLIPRHQQDDEEISTKFGDVSGERSTHTLISSSSGTNTGLAVLSYGGRDGSDTLSQSNGDSDEETLLTLTSFVSGSTFSKSPAAAISEQASSEPQCIMCLSTILASQIYTCTCGETYCADCLNEYIIAALKDEVLFPPKCSSSHSIFSEDSKKFLSQDIVTAYEDKEAELAIPWVQRIYCSACMNFIKPKSDINDPDEVTCPKCDSAACRHCKYPAHDEECPEDKGFNEILSLAKKYGWQTCPQCRAVVSLSTGCNHIICRCKHQFCYQCALPWKTCRCPPVTERFLYARADEIADREPPRLGITLEEPREAAHAHLINDCTTHDWRFSRNWGVCQSCQYFGEIFTMRCSGCGATRCRRCSMT